MSAKRPATTILRRTTSNLFTSLTDRLLENTADSLESGQRLRQLASFFGISESGAFKEGNYDLPRGFENWEEWETIVISTLKAQASHLIDNSSSPAELLELSLTRLGMIGEFSGGISEKHWLQIFHSLAEKSAPKRGLVTLKEARSFFNRVDGQRDNFELGKTFPISGRRRALMMWNWVFFASESMPSLCMFDNESCAFLLTAFEQKSNKATGGITPSNLSREKKKLHLKSCKKPIWSASFAGENRIKISCGTERLFYHVPSQGNATD